MPEVFFATPVLAVLPLAIGGPALKALRGPRDGIRAIYQFGLGGFGVENVALTDTVDKLAAAVRWPTPENLMAAREALEALANDDRADPAAGATAMTVRLSSPLTKSG
jgi:hypothetical protein